MGLKDLTNEDECSNAVTYATSLNRNAKYRGAGRWYFYPKGCHMLDHGHMYFNSHPTGTKHKNSKTICAGNRYFPHTPF